MATHEQIVMYAMYVIGKVESNHDWASVNPTDPITLGMMQWYGSRAAKLLVRVKNDVNMTDWNYLVANAISITDDVTNHPASDSDFWSHRFLKRYEENALLHIMESEANHIIQQSQWTADADYYITELLKWGLSESRPKQLIYAMCMYHQSPKRAGEVVRAAGGTASLSKLHTTCLNNSVLKVYKTRYNTAYNMLLNWDGNSDPPYFGQVLSTPRPDDTGGDSGTIDTDDSELGYIIEVGNTLVLYGNSTYKDGVIFHAAGAQRWVNGYKPDVTTIPDDADDGDGSTTDPSTAGQQLVDLMQSYIGDFDYSQAPGRLTPTTSGFTDCSGLCYHIYKKITGKNIGTWTGTQRNNGTKIFDGNPSGLVETNLRLGDLVFYNWDGSLASGIDHVEMYIGGGKVCGHGGPGKGPTIKNTIGRGAPYIMVRRYL